MSGPRHPFEVKDTPPALEPSWEDRVNRGDFGHAPSPAPVCTHMFTQTGTRTICLDCGVKIPTPSPAPRCFCIKDSRGLCSDYNGAARWCGCPCHKPAPVCSRCGDWCNGCGCNCGHPHLPSPAPERMDYEAAALADERTSFPKDFGPAPERMGEEEFRWKCQLLDDKDGLLVASPATKAAIKLVVTEARRARQAETDGEMDRSLIIEENLNLLAAKDAEIAALRAEAREAHREVDEVREDGTTRLRKAEAELQMVDEALARRPALADAPDRYTAIERACRRAGEADKAESRAERYREALEKIASNSSGGLLDTDEARDRHAMIHVARAALGEEGK